MHFQKSFPINIGENLDVTEQVLRTEFKNTVIGELRMKSQFEDSTDIESDNFMLNIRLSVVAMAIWCE